MSSWQLSSDSSEGSYTYMSETSVLEYNEIVFITCISGKVHNNNYTSLCHMRCNILLIHIQFNIVYVKSIVCLRSYSRQELYTCNKCRISM